MKQCYQNKLWRYGATKRISSMLLAFILSLTYSAQARDFTYTYEGQTLTYTVLDEDAKTCMIKSGDYTTPGNNVTGALIIPAKALDEDSLAFSVDSIGIYAFINCSSLTSVSLPETITGIGGAAFQYCSSITEVHIPSIEAWCNIRLSLPDASPCSSGNTELYCNGEMIKDVIIPEGITKINNYSFYNCI